MFLPSAQLSSSSWRPNRCPLSGVAATPTPWGRLVGDLGTGLALDGFTAERVRRVLEGRWGDAAAATWNHRLTALGSFRRWAQAQGWIADDPLAGIERRPQVRDDTPLADTAQA